LDRQPPDFHQESRLIPFPARLYRQVPISDATVAPTAARHRYSTKFSESDHCSLSSLATRTCHPMGNSPSVDQGSSIGAHVRDVGSSDSERQHDWSKEQLATAKPEEQSLREKLEPYNGAQRAAQKKTTKKEEDNSQVQRDDSSSSGDGYDVIPKEQRRHQSSTRQRARSPPPQIDSWSSDDEEQQQHACRQQKKTR